jgi:putative effector of murein hydrolase LrgA (UPF0299 family)
MIQAIALILGLVVAGEATVEALALPLPGPALGLLALTALFCCRGGPDEATGRLFDATCPHFPVLFVPAAVGVVATLDSIALLWPLLVAAVVLGTLATVLATALTAQLLLAAADRRHA